MGVNSFGDMAPDDFGSYDLAFVTMFSMTAGNSWVTSPAPLVPPFPLTAAPVLTLGAQFQGHDISMLVKAHIPHFFADWIHSKDKRDW